MPASLLVHATGISSSNPPITKIVTSMVPEFVIRNESLKMDQRSGGDSPIGPRKLSDDECRKNAGRS
jgi:hypothetical protein